MALQEIIIQGACEHNLRNIGLRLPRNRLITITGVSGSGKSSLACDTIYREGQRRFVESLSAYARQFMGRMDKPRVDHIEGLSPTVSIDQKSVNRNPRSSVGTITEIYDHFRLLFARLGIPHCPQCGREVRAMSADSIVERFMELSTGTAVRILAPVVRERKGEYRKDLEGWRLKGFVRARIDGDEVRLEDRINLHRYKKHTIELVLDRLKLKEDRRGRLAEAVESSLAMADGLVTIETDSESRTYSSRLSCPDCDVHIAEMEPRLFSFNSPQGACPLCNGLGTIRTADPDLIVPDPSLSINEGAIRTMTSTGYLTYARLGRDSLTKVAAHFGFDLDQPWSTLSKAQQDILLHGSGDEKVRLSFKWKSCSSSLEVKGEDYKPIKGIIPTMEEAYRFTKASHIEKFLSSHTCHECGGARLRAEALSVTFRGWTISRMTGMTVAEAARFFGKLALKGRDAEIGRDLLAEIRSRLDFLRDVGLDYLSLDRPASTLSGGEAQRVRLATQLGSGLQGILYVLDEPSIGLHQRDNRRLIETLAGLRDRGNSVVVVEHDRDMMAASDFLVDLGPGAGRHGGEVVALGSPAAVTWESDGITSRFLRNEEEIPVPVRRKPDGRLLEIVGAKRHNLKEITVSIPVGLFTVVTGVSGSGKSSLVEDTLVPALRGKLGLGGRRRDTGEYSEIRGAEFFDRIVEINQSPIGRTPRSNPATYTKVFDLIRAVFASTGEARMRAFGKGRFSFNKKGGRCETCRGSGVLEMEMHFLPNVEIPCEECAGHRYNRETLDILYRGKSIHDVLEMTVEEALLFFANHRKIHRILETLRDTGLGYVALGQSSTTLSGGEAQRVKLSAELCRPAKGRTLYVLDEPTTGLHFADIRLLLDTLQKLVDSGNTMVVVEHNPDVIKVADFVVDLGPEGGENGGKLVAAGRPEKVARVKASRTGAVLKEILAPSETPRKPARSTGRKKGRPGIGDQPAIWNGDGAIRLEGARVHNLKNLDVSIPHNRFTVVTGVSGSGKTSLAFDTVFAEGQRRFVESLSTYARRFVARLDKVPVERISGLAPAIAIDQRSTVRNPRSTVATSTEIHDYLRVLFTRIGRSHCPGCGKPIRSFSPGTAAGDLIENAPGKKVIVAAPLYVEDLQEETALTRPDDLGRLAAELRKKGYLRIMVDGRIMRLDDDERSLPAEAGVIELVVDRIKASTRNRGRLAESIESAYQEGHGMALIHLVGEDSASDPDLEESLFYSSRPGCLECGFFMDDLNPRMFSFNSHLGACPRCDGLGEIEICDHARLISDPSKPILDGAMPHKVGEWLTGSSGIGGLAAAAVRAVGRMMDFDPDLPWRKIPAAGKKAILRGEGIPGKVLTVTMKRESAKRKREYTFETEWDGILAKVEEWYRGADVEGWRSRVLGAMMRRSVCAACNGARLRPEVVAVTLGDRSISQVTELTIDQALAFLNGLELEGDARVVASDALKEITNRLAFLKDVGLGYLTLARSSSTLSGGEAQRIRLASQLGNRLVGVIYVLDEPTVGLHQRDVDRLLGTLVELRDLGNTVIAVEHDRGTILKADHVIDMGPGAGRLGGRIVAQGKPADLAEDGKSLTGLFLSGRRSVGAMRERRTNGRRTIRLRGASRHNLKRLDVAFPLGTLTVVTGVSGSGKSTLVMGLLREGLSSALKKSRLSVPGLKAISGARYVDKMVVIDQSPIGRSSASNPATYTKVFDPIRQIFASTTEARMRGFGKGRFSFNSGEGRCAVCKGRGVEVVEMHFLSDVTITCEACRGKRFDRETLSVQYRGKTISDVLDMDVREASDFFRNHGRIKKILDVLENVGLGYILLGQSSATLSGGEAQRVKLAAELCRPDTGRTLYLLDEPTTGLHFEDVRRLMGVLQALADRGNTVIVVEHNPDVIVGADHVIDLGPEGGDAGGEIVAAGTPEEVARVPRSHTGREIAGLLGQRDKSKGVCAG